MDHTLAIHASVCRHVDAPTIFAIVNNVPNSHLVGVKISV
jgi:hypothetical protein